MSLTLEEVVDALKKKMDDVEFLDVGRGTEIALGCSMAKLHEARNILREREGFEVYTIKYTKTDGTHTITTIKVLTKKGNTWKDCREAAANGFLHHLEEKK